MDVALIRLVEKYQCFERMWWLYLEGIIILFSFYC
jgi:hypothetical protein